LTPLAVLALISGSGRALAADDPGAADLKKRSEELRVALTTGDKAKAGKITKALLPDKARIQKALSDSAPADAVAQIVEMHSKFLAAPEEKLAGLFSVKPEQTEVQVHASTTEALKAYAKGTPAFEEFPSAVKKLAEAGILRPATTFYEVEYLEPGKTAGMKYHLFYWDGSDWAMLGPVWRATATAVPPGTPAPGTAK
jgi:hypothetical protein